MLKQRVITALILAPLILLALFGLPDNYLMLLFALIIMAGSIEWLKLADLKTILARSTFLLIQLVLLVSAWWISLRESWLAVVILVSAVLVWFLILFWLAMYEKGRIKLHLSIFSRSVLGFILLPICFLGIAFIIQNFTNNRMLILIMFLLIWGADVAAYFSGKSFGRHKLAPVISPGKTWEGVIGAMFGTVIVASVAGWLTGHNSHMLVKFILYSQMVIVISIVGDLLESLLKRQVGIKDSSNLLPGHGGVLDRIDSMVAASPVYALGIYLLGMA